MAQEGVTAEGIQELKTAADMDVQDANVTAQMQQTVQENQVALRTAQLIGDGALKAVQRLPRRRAYCARLRASCAGR